MNDPLKAFDVEISCPHCYAPNFCGATPGTPGPAHGDMIMCGTCLEPSLVGMGPVGLAALAITVDQIPNDADRAKYLHVRAQVKARGLRTSQLKVSEHGEIPE